MFPEVVFSVFRSFFFFGQTNWNPIHLPFVAFHSDGMHSLIKFRHHQALGMKTNTHHSLDVLLAGCPSPWSRILWLYSKLRRQRRLSLNLCGSPGLAPILSRDNCFCFLGAPPLDVFCNFRGPLYAAMCGFIAMWRWLKPAAVIIPL